MSPDLIGTFFYIYFLPQIKKIHKGFYLRVWDFQSVLLFLICGKHFVASLESYFLSLEKIKLWELKKEFVSLH
jgi:hypothetical protein